MTFECLWVRRKRCARSESFVRSLTCSRKYPHYCVRHRNQSSFQCQVQHQVKPVLRNMALFAAVYILPSFLSREIVPWKQCPFWPMKLNHLIGSLCSFIMLMFASSLGHLMVEFQYHSQMLNFMLRMLSRSHPLLRSHYQMIADGGGGGRIVLFCFVLPLRQGFSV